MNQILSRILYLILYIISLFPFWIIYVMSDYVHFILFNIIGYRRKIVRQNLILSFPEKSKEELEVIQKKFEHRFCDLWFEMIKSISMSKDEVNRRFKANWEVLNRYQQAQKNCFVLMGHQFNWEWANNASQINTQQLAVGIYMPINAKVIDLLVQKIRKRWDTGLVSAKNFAQDLSKFHDQLYFLGLLADQSPGGSKNKRFFPFLNRPTAFTIGPAKGAATHKVPLVFASIYNVKRGFYEAHLEEIVEDASIISPEEATLIFVKKLESSIRHQPENWLWTHRRWKLSPTENDIIIS